MNEKQGEIDFYEKEMLCIQDRIRHIENDDPQDPCFAPEEYGELFKKLDRMQKELGWRNKEKEGILLDIVATESNHFVKFLHQRGYIPK